MSTKPQVTLSAGRFESAQERNYKYSGAPVTSFETLVDDIVGLAGYPFLELMFEVDGKKYYFDLTGVKE